MSCPDRQVLEQFAAGRLSPEDAERTEVHIAACRRCGRLLGELADDPVFIEQLRDAEGAWADMAPELARLMALEGTITTTLLED